MRNILREVLKSKELATHFEKGMFSAKVETTWLPLVVLGEAKRRLGLTVEGDWVVESKMGLIKLSEPKAFVFVLPLLENTIDSLKAQVNKTVGLKEIGEVILHEFPFSEVASAGFEQGSDYWANLALDWYRDLPEGNKLQLQNSLKTVSKAKWASQELRQATLREIKQHSQG